MAHFVMAGEGPYPCVGLSRAPNLPGGPWYRGRPLAIAVPDVIRYDLSVRPPFYDDEIDEWIPSPSQPKVLCGAASIPVMRNDLLETLLACGVDNLEVFAAELRDNVNDVTYRNYSAFNGVGLVAAADLEQSELMPHMSQASMLDTDFDALVIDPLKAGDFLLFRLAECCSAIIVHEQVKDEVEKQGIPGVEFYEDGTWAG